MMPTDFSLLVPAESSIEVWEARFATLLQVDLVEVLLSPVFTFEFVGSSAIVFPEATLVFRYGDSTYGMEGTFTNTIYRTTCLDELQEHHRAVVYKQWLDYFWEHVFYHKLEDVFDGTVPCSVAKCFMRALNCVYPHGTKLPSRFHRLMVTIANTFELDVLPHSES